METQCGSTSPLDLEDIEDLFSDGSEDVKTLRQRNLVVPKVKKRARARPELIEDEPWLGERCFLPGLSSIYIKTWGCAHNSSDSEYMAGQLAAQGYTLTEDKSLADLWILNSCTVKNPAESHFRNEIDQGLKEGRKVIVSGCVPQGKPDANYIKGLSVIGVQQIDRVIEVVEETLKGNQVRLLGSKKVQVMNEEEFVGKKSIKKAGGANLALPKVRRNPLIEIIAISTGCLNQCTYCKTKHARGELGSYPMNEIVERAKQSFKEGVIEIWLTSEDTGAYGRDIGATLPELLWKLVEVIPENCRLRLGMTNPPYILDHLDEISKIMTHPRVYKFLHVPVQSGSDAVLAEMKREYSRDDFCKVVEFLRKQVPGMTIATDIICGFPTETEEDFQETLSLCQKYKFPTLFINQFYSRPGTVAAKMKALPTQVVKHRTKKMTDLFYSYEPFRDRIGVRCSILVTDLSHDKEHYVGHNEFYEQVLIPKQEELLGKVVNVEIVSVSKFSMMGRVLDATGANEVTPLKAGQVSGVATQADNSSLFLMKWSLLFALFVLCFRIFQLFMYY